jgi:hypothetical protein
MAALANTRREQYAEHQPRFWRQATGFLIATLIPAPPVYDPGGRTCLIDDFVVIPAANWLTTGVELLRTSLGMVGDTERAARARQLWMTAVWWQKCTRAAPAEWMRCSEARQATGSSAWPGTRSSSAGPAYWRGV